MRSADLATAITCTSARARFTRARKLTTPRFLYLAIRSPSEPQQILDQGRACNHTCTNYCARVCMRNRR